MEGVANDNLLSSAEGNQPADRPFSEGQDAISRVRGSEFFPERLATVQQAVPLANTWLDNALHAFGVVRRHLNNADLATYPCKVALDAMRRHFHTDRRDGSLDELNAAAMVERNFRTMKLALATSNSIFVCVDGETAAWNTRGYFGSEFIVPAYAYSHNSIAFTDDFEKLGPKCRSAVIIHQLAHFIDVRIKDHGCRGPLYERLDFQTAMVNVHAYPNFAINVSPPYIDERFGMMRSDE